MNTYPDTTDKELAEGIHRQRFAPIGSYSYGLVMEMRAELIRRRRIRNLTCSDEEYLAATKGE